MLKIGCHLSVADGFLAMAKDAIAINANVEEIALLRSLYKNDE